jgi:valyl-tRNA synthetase
MELPKVYSPEETESRWYDQWEAKGYFKPLEKSSGDAFTIVIPPPNVTGSLHMGHALNNTLQDILIRWRRMQGRPALWIPGTDHGGIATQNVVEKILKTEKKTRHDLGRDAFLARMWQWRRETGDVILKQLRRLGASLDWSRTRFTMDEVASRAVVEAFLRLFKKGLIYRGPRMVNWCPRCHTALSDIEVEHEELPGKLWHIHYPLEEGGGHIVVATTRPETMLGDMAVAVNPEDPRYKDLIGRKLLLPLMNRAIPVIADAAVDASFGTGAVKVTPAHDVTDFEIGERHRLSHEVVIGFDGKMTDRAGAYAGLDRFEARKRIVADLTEKGLLEKEEDYRLAVSICYRCLTHIEPLVSEQWFLKMSDMAARAAAATREGKVRIFPSTWEKPYLLWLDNIKDWCISRQIWWGHRIPVWYCPNSAQDSRMKAAGMPHKTSSLEPRADECPPIAAAEKPAVCPNCGSKDLVQDEDVLDTWFSSGLWPLSVFRWPEQTDDLKKFYPTSVLVTGHEILYLWVARMVMMGLEFEGDVPFRHVYIHGIVRDKHGKKMSKSLGNVIDPLEIMKKYGTDALRLSLSESSIPGRDMQLSNDSFLKARNFANKLWNASRFVLMNLEGYRPAALPPRSSMTLADLWILDELQAAVSSVTDALERYNPAEAARGLYEFVWSSFCDWYVEIAKIRLNGTDPGARQTAQSVLINCLEKILCLLHPVMPYETEEIYQAIRPFVLNPADSIMIQHWPVEETAYRDNEAAGRMAGLRQVVTAIRTLRSEMNVTPGKQIDCFVKTSDSQWSANLSSMEWQAEIKFLARVNSLSIDAKIERPHESAVAVFDAGEIYVPLKGLIDMAKEKARLEKNLGQVNNAIARDAQMYGNTDFRKHAPKEEVERLASRLKDNQTKAALLKRNLEGFNE